MTIKDIKKNLILGLQFENSVADWYTLANIKESRYILSIGGTYNLYTNLNSMAKDVLKLINTGSI